MEKKRTKSYYLKCSKQARTTGSRACLDAGMRGFLITCNMTEPRCLREAYSILNEYADALYGPEDVAAATADADADADVEAAMKREVEALRDRGARERRFQAVDSGARNCIFIRTTLDEPAAVARAIMADAAAGAAAQRARYIMRLTPVAATCRARDEDVRRAADTLFERDFATPLGDGRTFGVVFRSRYNHTLRRDDVVRSLAEVVAEKNAAHRVNLADPQLAVVVEVVANVCCLSVLTDYARFRKYNLSELYGETRRRQADEAPSDAGKAESGERKDAEDAGKALSEGRDGDAAGDAGTGEGRDGNEAGEGGKNMEAEEGGENMEAGGDASPNDCGDENGEAVDEALVVTTKLDAGDGMLREICDEEKSKSVDETLVISNNAVKLDAKDETLGKNCDEEKSESANETLATDTVT